jgi:hypothetical protein
MEEFRNIYSEDDQDELLDEEELDLDEWAFMKGYVGVRVI